jgi:hypothetical protein
MPIFDAGSSAYQGTTVTSSATAVFSTTGLTSPQNVTVMNQGTATIYVGGGTVTTTSGVQLLPGGQVTVTGQAAQNLWAITASGTATAVAGLATVAVAV